MSQEDRIENIRTNNRTIYVKYQSNEPVGVESHVAGNQPRLLPITTVNQLIGAYFSDIPPHHLAQYTLHLTDDEPLIPGNTMLDTLEGSMGQYDTPFIIKRKEQGIVELIAGFWSWGESNSGTSKTNGQRNLKTSGHSSPFCSLWELFSSPFSTPNTPIPENSPLPANKSPISFSATQNGGGMLQIGSGLRHRHPQKVSEL